MNSSLRLRNKLWLISDTHFGHKNIARYCQRPATHDIIMYSNWIDRVGENDQILHLGDVIVKWDGTAKRWLKAIARLPGEKYLIKGNHDMDEDEPYEDAGFVIIPEFTLGGVVFTHRPVSAQFPGPNDEYVSGEWHTNIHGHTHNNAYSPEHDGVLADDKTYLNVCVEHTDLAPIQLGNIYPRKNWYAEEWVSSATT